MKKLVGVGLSAVMTLGLWLAVGAHQPANAGAVGGPKRTTSLQRVRAKGTHTYDIRFRADEVAEVWADGDGDIDMFVYDEDGRRVDFDDDPDGIPVCSFVPRWTQTFTIKIVNCEDYSVDYRLRTN
jgi:hypothetical protein